MARGCDVTDRISGTGAVSLARELRIDCILRTSASRSFKKFTKNVEKSLICVMWQAEDTC
jgi:hypothetical protein